MLEDGLDALRAEIGIDEIASLIERTAKWVAPETFRLLPVWFPEHARGTLFFKSHWSEPQNNVTRSTGAVVHKRESNTYANRALTMALGLRSSDRPNWSCCHIWGVDDSRYIRSNAVVQDRRFYSCVANMVLLPTPLKAFTDVMPEIKAMLRLCARNLYDWQCDLPQIQGAATDLEPWANDSAYPGSWPRSPGGRRPTGVVPISPLIENWAAKRLMQIRSELRNAGQSYPREEVLNALAYWKIEP